jgi:cytochrome c oxidase cbb3-type subunit 3
MRPAQLILWIVGVAVATGCDKPPPADSLKEWTPADHHSKDDSQRQATGNQTAPVSKDASAASATQTLLDVTWRNQCATCHGMMGRGDGPQGPMFKATDFTSADWQARVTDEDIKSTIKNGKGRMPKFDLPDDVVAALVQRIRALRGR